MKNILTTVKEINEKMNEISKNTWIELEYGYFNLTDNDKELKIEILGYNEENLNYPLIKIIFYEPTFIKTNAGLGDFYKNTDDFINILNDEECLKLTSEPLSKGNKDFGILPEILFKIATDVKNNKFTYIIASSIQYELINTY